MDRDATTATSLPEDVVGEILLRVKDMADLFHCARTCKRWSRLVADIRRHRPDQMSTSLLSGFFPKRGKVRYLFPTPGSLFGPDRRLLGSFLRGTARDLSRATPLFARHGLLLMRLPSSDAPSIIHLALCNLLAGTCDELPPLKIRWKFDKGGYAIITDADRSSNDVENSNVSMTKIVTPTEDILSGTYYEPQLSVATDETLSLLCLQRPGLQIMNKENKCRENIVPTFAEKEDVREILMHMEDTTAVFHCAAMSKLWRRLLPPSSLVG
ncbi:hypothetical protein VPH35_140195 [Triticum aestivum]